jgi:hypothetical protein
MAIFLIDPVFLRSSRDSRRVICLQDHSMFRGEGHVSAINPTSGVFDDGIGYIRHRCRLLPIHDPSLFA